jgi:DNA helicase HerA-like ATPase
MTEFTEAEASENLAQSTVRGTIPLGRVAAPPDHESTSGVFYFWVDRNKAVERTQIVTTTSNVAGRSVKFIGIIQEVYRRSRQRDIGEESDRFDGRTSERPPFDSEGVTYAEVSILRTDPVAHMPPTEESEVCLATPLEAARGYGLDRMGQRLDIGLLRNGGTQFAGRAAIDLDFLLGKNGGHLNVNGIAGLGTKSTLLLIVNWLLLRRARIEKEAAPSGNRLQFVPIVFNVKNFDLFFIDRWNATFLEDPDKNVAEWKDIGILDPKPFENVQFFAPQQKNMTIPATTGRTSGDVQSYSWSLSDIIEQRLFKFLFSEEDVYEANFGGLVGELEEWLTTETGAGPKLRTTDGAPQTFQQLLDWFKQNKADKEFFGDAHAGTKGKLLRRLKYVVQEGDGVLRRSDPEGNPLTIPAAGVEGPIVIDLFALNTTPSLQRFVVAAVLNRIIEYRSGKQVKGLRYLITLDELNRFAPKGGSDPITQQIEMVAAEMRSQGVILLGAQQQASLVSPRVIENSAVRALGRSGTLELGQDVWKFLGPSPRSSAAQLQPEEKLLYQPSFREPMLAKIAFPPFALSESDASLPSDGANSLIQETDADLDAF